MNKTKFDQGEKIAQSLHINSFYSRDRRRDVLTEVTTNLVYLSRVIGIGIPIIDG